MSGTKGCSSCGKSASAKVYLSYLLSPICWTCFDKRKKLIKKVKAVSEVPAPLSYAFHMTHIDSWMVH